MEIFNNYKVFLWLLSVLIVIISNIIYFISIFKWQTKPHTLSFFIWTLSLAIVYLWQVYDNSWAWSYLTLAFTILCFIIFILSFKYWIRNITLWNKLSILWIIIAIIIWWLTNSPLISIIILVIIDWIWYLPTIQKLKTMPYSENLISWWLGAISFVISIFAIDNFSIITVIYPFVMAILNTITIVASLYYRKILKITN